MGMKILITGAGGFIGSHLAEQCVEAGFDVRAFVRYNSGGTWGWLEQSHMKKDMEIVAGDIRDMDSVKRAMQGCSGVFHLAALIGIPYSYQSPLAYIRTNVEGTYNILESARSAGVENVVVTSTSEIYGTAQYVPIDEQHPLQGQSPYSASKIGADKMAEAFHLSFGLPVVTVGSPRLKGRPFLGIDNAAAAGLAAEHFVGLGHRRLGVVGLPPRLPLDDGPVVDARPGFARRVSGFVAAAERSGAAAGSVAVVPSASATPWRAASRAEAVSMTMSGATRVSVTVTGIGGREPWTTRPPSTWKAASSRCSRVRRCRMVSLTRPRFGAKPG